MGEAKKQALRKDHNVGEHYARYTFYDLAFNIRPTEIGGFLGNEQLQYWDEIVAKRALNFQQFQKAAENNPDLLPLHVQHMDCISNFAMPVVCKDKEVLEKYKKRFEDNRVEIRPIIAGDMTQQPFYRKYVSSGEHCTNARFVHQNGFYFCNNPELTGEEVDILHSLLLP